MAGGAPQPHKVMGVADLAMFYIVTGVSLRWIATDTGTRLDPGLHRNLAGLSVRLPALREQPARIPHLVVATARSWCQARRVPARRFDDLAMSLLEE